MKNRTIEQFKLFTLGLFSNPQLILSNFNFSDATEEEKRKILLELELLKIQTELVWIKNEK